MTIDDSRSPASPKILVRLPNWLGDMVMAVGFIHGLREVYPDASLGVIVKKGLQDLLPFFPKTDYQYVFDKSAYSGPAGAYRFGKEIRQKERFDLFFCLPDSFSSAIMGWGTGARKRIGYRKEIRQVFLTHSYKRPESGHRVEEYVQLLEKFSGKSLSLPQVKLGHSFSKADHVVVNINSEASSRRLTGDKATELLGLLRKTIREKIFLVGAPKEQAFVESVFNRLPDKNGVVNLAGKTTLPQLAEVLATARAMLTTDSGPAHLANALGTHTVVLFGAGNEANTAPYQQEHRTIIRLGQLSCEPCTKNVCVRYAIPLCLERLDSFGIVSTVNKVMHG